MDGLLNKEDSECPISLNSFNKIFRDTMNRHAPYPFKSASKGNISLAHVYVIRHINTDSQLKSVKSQKDQQSKGMLHFHPL